MGLDLIPRVDGEVVDADSTSVVELYKVVSYYFICCLYTCHKKDMYWIIMVIYHYFVCYMTFEICVSVLF